MAVFTIDSLVGSTCSPDFHDPTGVYTFVHPNIVVLGGGPPGGPAGGDLGGTYPDPTVVGIQTIPVDPTTPTTGQALVFDLAGQWAPTTLTPDANFVFTQSSPASTWTVVHNLNKRCSVTVVDSSFREILAEVTYIDDNTVQIDFASTQIGSVYCN